MTDETTKPDEQTETSAQLPSAEDALALRYAMGQALPEAPTDAPHPPGADPADTSWGGTCELCAQETQHEGQPCDECLEILEHDEQYLSAHGVPSAEEPPQPSAPAADDQVVTLTEALAELRSQLPFIAWERRPGTRPLTAKLWGMNLSLTQEARQGEVCWRCVISGPLADHDGVRRSPADAVLDALDAAWTWARLASAGPSVRPLLPGEVSQLEAQRAKAEAAQLQERCQQLQAQVHQLQERCAALETRQEHNARALDQQDTWLRENDQAISEGLDRVKVWQQAAQDALDQLAEAQRQRAEIAQQAERAREQSQQDMQQLLAARAQLQALLQGLGARQGEAPHQVLEFTIENHRGEVRDVKLLGSTVSLYTEPDEHHPETGLKVKGWDLARQAWRSFNLWRQLVTPGGCHYDFREADRQAAHKACHELAFTEEMNARATWLVGQMPSGKLYLVGLGKGEAQGMLYVVERQSGTWDQAGEGNSSPYRVRLGPAGTAPLTFPAFLGASLFESIEGAERARAAVEARRQRDEETLRAPQPQVQVHVKGADAAAAMQALEDKAMQALERSKGDDRT